MDTFSFVLSDLTFEDRTESRQATAMLLDKLTVSSPPSKGED